MMILGWPASMCVSVMMIMTNSRIQKYGLLGGKAETSSEEDQLGLKLTAIIRVVGVLMVDSMDRGLRVDRE